jgi:transposase
LHRVAAVGDGVRETPATGERRPFGGPDPPAAAYFYSPDRSGVHAERFLEGFTGVMQADAFSGFGRLYKPGRVLGPIIEAACWSHARRGFFELAELQKAPIAIEAVQRIDALFAIEREINGLSASQRLAVRAERSRPLVDALAAWLRDQYARLSAKSATAKAIDYMLKRWPAFTRFLDDGTICLSNNAAERDLRPAVIIRKTNGCNRSPAGATVHAVLASVIRTAHKHGHDFVNVTRQVLQRPMRVIVQLCNSDPAPPIVTVTTTHSYPRAASVT